VADAVLATKHGSLGRIAARAFREVLMRVVIVGGGTGGHTSTGLAVAEALRARGVEVSWMGSANGIEARRVPAAGIPFHAVPAGKLRRYWDWQNLPDLLYRVPASFVLSLKLLRTIRPHLLFATGGFVALPPAVAARVLNIPVVVHEQTAVAGLANRLAGRLASKVLLTFREASKHFPADRVVITGNPLRPELAGGSREAGLAQFGLDPGFPVIYVTGGAQGSHRINRTVGEILPRLLELTQVIHQCGASPKTEDLEWLEGLARRLPAHLRVRYRVLDEMVAKLRSDFGIHHCTLQVEEGTTHHDCALEGHDHGHDHDHHAHAH